jgi:hypothetical protein
MPHQHTKIAIITLALLTIVGLSASALGAISAANFSTSEIELNFTITHPSYSLTNLYVNGVNQQDSVTYQADNLIEFDALGTGEITLVDQHGRVYYRASKLTVGQAHYVVKVDFATIGNYELTLRFNQSETNFIEAKVNLAYKPLALPPNTGLQASPETSYTYIGGYAINNVDAILLAVILTAVAVLIFLFVHHSTDDKLAASTTSGVRRSKTRVLKSPKVRKAIRRK